jgi:hypothetical protein
MLVLTTLKPQISKQKYDYSFHTGLKRATVCGKFRTKCNIPFIRSSLPHTETELIASQNQNTVLVPENNIKMTLLKKSNQHFYQNSTHIITLLFGTNFCNKNIILILEKKYAKVCRSLNNIIK